MRARGRGTAASIAMAVLCGSAVAMGGAAAATASRGGLGQPLVRMGAAQLVAPGSLGPTLTSVSCPLRDDCVAVGTDVAGRAIVTEGTESSGRWHWSAVSRLAAGPSGADDLASVSCPTSSSCVAVGADGGGHAEATTGTRLATGWRWSAPSVLGGAGPTGTRLRAVACPTATTCVAVGADASNVGIASHGARHGSTWTWTSPSPIGVAGATEGGLVAVSCATRSTCFAVGSDAHHEGIVAIGAVQPGSTAWSIPVEQPPDASGSGQLTGVSCPTSTSCVLVGDDAAGDATVAVWTSSTGSWRWTASRRLPGVATEEAVSCPSPRVCVAVGSTSGVPGEASYALARIEHGVRTWLSPDPVPLAPRASSDDPVLSLAAVSCAADDACVAVGVDESRNAVATASLSTPTPARAVVAHGGDARALVTWRAPAFDGGELIGSYRVVASPGGEACNARAAANLRCTIEHLVNGTRYRLSVTADNGLGTSTPSFGARAVTPSPYQPPVPSPLTGAVASYVASRAAEVTVTVHDVSTGQTWTIDPTSVQHTASIVKVDILADLLYDHQKTGVPLSASTVELATSMIEDSDNDAATALFNEDGQAPGLSSFNQLVGLTGTTVSYAWGFTDTTSADQATLVELFAVPNDVLTSTSRQFGLRLMRHVTSEQDWGVSSGPTPGTSVALKNGWYPTEPLAWQVNSIGWIDGHGRNYVLAVLTRDDSTMGDGIETIEAISTMVRQHLARVSTTRA